MPNIDRLNGVTATDISSVDSHNASAIASINGQDLVTTSFLLDDYGTDIVGAYSVRKLSSTYSGSAIRVREGLFNSEADIGFDASGNLDEAALLSHCSSNGTGYIVKWYDQSGNSKDVTQTSSTKQMQIVSGSAVIKIGTKPAPIANVTRTHYLIPTPSPTFNPTSTAIVVVQPTVTSGNYEMIGEHPYAPGVYKFGGHNDRLFLNAGSTISTADGAISQAHMIAVGVANGASSIIRANGSQLATGNTSGNNYEMNTVFGGYDTSSNMRGNMQELLIYSADKSADIADIETNINTYFSIYP